MEIELRGHPQFPDRFEKGSSRPLVHCDNLACEAFQAPDPNSLDELRIALEHWQDHGYLSGCSHGQ